MDVFTYQRVDQVVAISETVAEQLRQWPYAGVWRQQAWRRSAKFGPELVAVPNGVDAMAFAMNTEARATVRATCGISETETVAVTVSRLDRHKAVDRVIAALTSPVASRVRLIVVGDGPEAAALADLAARRGVADRVIFTGRLPQDETARFLSAADVFVFPVRDITREGLPLSLLEALASGLEVLVPEDSSFGPELDHRFQRVDMRTVETLAGKLASAAPTSDRASRLPEKHTDAVTARRYRDLLERLVTSEEDSGHNHGRRTREAGA
jgi:glycosyltransferase involved in cell wall biosynthesis